MMCVMLVTELGVPWLLRNVPISVACEKYWIFCGVIYLICEPLLLRPPYERYRAQLEYKLTLCGFLHCGLASSSASLGVPVEIKRSMGGGGLRIVLSALHVYHLYYCGSYDPSGTLRDVVRSSYIILVTLFCTRCSQNYS